MGNLYMEASQINYRGGEKKMSVEEALKNTSGEAAAIAQLQQDVTDLNDVKANKITIAPTFSDEASYDPGDLVYYNGLTYRCVNAHEGEWDADDFAATTIDGELAELRSGLTNLLKYVDITVTDTITLTANIAAYRDYPQTGIPDGSALIGVRLLSATGDALDGNVGAYLGAFNFIHLLSTINKSFTSITFRIYFYGGS